MTILDQFSVAGSLWVRVIEQAKSDLVSQDGRLAFKAARYFFLEPVADDESDIRTFAGLCAATRINNDAAAKAIFRELKSDQQERILGLLRDVGYEGIQTEVIM